MTTRDWAEDAGHENGNYSNLCSDCGQHFTGHKRRVTCKLCALPDPWENAKRNARPDCPMCKGAGTYMYDHNHGTICKRCCLHNMGRWRLSWSYSGWPGMCCRAGCGHVVRNPLEALMRWILDNGGMKLYWWWSLRRYKRSWWQR